MTKEELNDTCKWLNDLLVPFSPDDPNVEYRPRAGFNTQDDKLWVFIYWYEGRRYVVGFDWSLIQRRDSERILEIFKREKLVDRALVEFFT